MKFYRVFGSITLLFLFTGCIEIIDDLQLNADKSGTLNYTINLSSSKIRVNSILALDSLNGQKVPELDSIKKQIHLGLESLKTKKGIKSVDFKADYTEFIFKLKIEFQDLSSLQNAFRELAKNDFNAKLTPKNEENWLTFHEQKFIRSIPQFILDQEFKISTKDKEKLKEGRYTSITRFTSDIVSCSNASVKISANKKACMVQKNTFDILESPQLLDNIIELK